ncbi:MAG: ATP-binding protein [Rhodospirillaceae bacterium]
MSYPTSFLERHRPTAISELVFADDAASDEIHAQLSRALPRSILLYGPFGTGKTATAKVFANTILDDTYNFNGKFWTGSEFVSVSKVAEVRSFFSYTAVCARFRAGIIDELHAMPFGAQMALRDVMDSIGGSAVLIGTANDLSKVDAGVLDRFTQIYWGQPAPTRWLPRARQILAAEGLMVPDATLLSVLTDAGSSIRSIMRNLEDLVEMARNNDHQQSTGAP